MRSISSKRVRVLAMMIGLAMLLSSCAAGAEKKKKAKANAVAESVMEALKGADFDSVSTLSGGLLSSENFIDPDWMGSEAVFSEMFGSMTWKFGEVMYYSDTAYTVKVEITHKDLDAAGNAIMDDPEKRLEVFGALVLDYAEKEGGPGYTELPTEYLLDELENNSQDIVSTGAIELVYDEEEKIWTLDTVPDIFAKCLNYDVTVDPTVLVESGEYLSGMLEASYKLTIEGKIDLDTYRFMYFSCGEKVLEPVESIQADIMGSGWFDMSTQDYSAQYKEGTTSIVYYFALQKLHPGVEFVCETYKDDPTNIIKTETTIMTDMPEDQLAVFTTDVPEGLVKGIYGVTISSSDGSIVLQQEVEVK